MSPQNPKDNTNSDKTNQINNETKNKLNKLFKIQNSNFILIILCACALMQNLIVGGANNAVLTTIERAYFMTSIESALFLSFYDIANILASPIIGYYGDRKSKQKIISLSMFGLSLGSFVMLIPEFVMLANYDLLDIRGDNDTELQKDQVVCIPITLIELVQNKTMNVPNKIYLANILMKKMKYVFYAANVINGISSVALYTIVITYIESIFEKEQANIRQGIYYAIGALGVGVGMLITGNFLNINVGSIHDAGTMKSWNKKLNSNSMNWIGAWWIIYIIGFILNLLLCILVTRFSPNQVFKYIESNVNNCVHNNESTNNEQTIKKSLKDFFKNAFLILSNRIFFFIIICTTFETFLIKGFSSYLTKYLEYQYRLPASTSTMIAGGIGFLSLVFGPLSGAYIVRRFKWHVKECAKFVVLILFITSLLFLGLIIHCPQEKYINSENSLYLKSNCNCDSNTFYPICYKNIYIFQTPCHAGCTRFTRPNSYSKCRLLDNYLLVNHTNDTNILLPCQRPAPYCIKNLVIVSFIGFAILFLSSIVILPILKIILESTDEENQSFALGIRSLITKLFGNIPGPIMFATVVDKSCIQWTHNSLSNKTCRLYDNKLFSLGLGIFGAVIRFSSAIFALITLMFIKKQKIFTVSTDTIVESNFDNHKHIDHKNEINNFSNLNKS